MTTEHAEAPKRDCLCPCHACKKGCACPVAGGCCPNAPKPPEAPKVEEYLRTGDGPDTLYPAKPAPAPEPKQGSACKHGVTPPNIFASCAAIKSWEAEQGSEEPDFEAAIHDAEIIVKRYDSPEYDWPDLNRCRALLALRAEVEVKTTAYTKLSEWFNSARAELAAAREEIAKLRKFVSEAMHEADAEKARADRAEDAVRHSVHRNHKHTPEGCTGCEHVEAILAARASKEGGSR